jgi:hypothetical protein
MFFLLRGKHEEKLLVIVEEDAYCVCPLTVNLVPHQLAGGPPMSETTLNSFKCAISVFYNA